MGPLETALNVIVDFRSSLAKIGPFLRVLEKAVLVRPFGGPDDAGRGA